MLGCRVLSQPVQTEDVEERTVVERGASPAQARADGGAKGETGRRNVRFRRSETWPRSQDPVSGDHPGRAGRRRRLGHQPFRGRSARARADAMAGAPRHRRRQPRGRSQPLARRQHGRPQRARRERVGPALCRLDRRVQHRSRAAGPGRRLSPVSAQPAAGGRDPWRLRRSAATSNSPASTRPTWPPAES